VTLLDRVHAACYDPVLRSQERRWLGAARRELLASARGTVLELGAGTGANLDHLTVAAPEVTRWIATEPSAPMVARLRRRAEAAQRRAEAAGHRAGTLELRVERRSAEALPYPDASVDTVVSTMVLCSVPRLSVALRELRRVLRPDGQLVLLEHVAASGAAGAVQRLVAPPWKVLGNGCHLHRDTVGALGDAGFGVEDVRPLAAGPAVSVLPFVAGTAAPRPTAHGR
jgi:ubiquinone/menaquinone biosynthesis C-methylase UbiE